MRGRWLIVAAALVVILGLVSLAALYTGVAETTTEIMQNIRAPRIVMALLIGGGLGVAGALMQGSLGNPLADPGIVGVSAGAALGAVAAVSLGASFGTGITSLLACVGAGVALTIIVAVSLHDMRPEVVTLLLAGVAVTAFGGAVLAVLISMSPSAAVRSITFWSSGSLALSTWNAVISVAPFILAGLVVAGFVAKPLNVLSLGDRAALTSGVNVAKVRYWSLGAVVLLVAAGVASVGTIAFVGLLVPHAVRMLAGPSHGRLLVLSGLAGALLILAADTLARVVANPMEIPIGAITAVIGAPVFFLLLRKTRKSQGGWA